MTADVRFHKGDLFELAYGECKVHCVSADLAMGKGIATEFRKKYGKPVLEKKPRVGECVAQTVKEGGKEITIFHLITKEKYYEKPTGETLSAALKSLADKKEEKKFTSLWMPKIGTGLDKLDWEKDVLPAVKNLAKETQITVNVVFFE